ncbi:succinylglutamate desuccinylase [Pseudomonas oryzihabitans]|nr:succinylglutamate desuccinylase [Pseudomonas psychrotolerans]
MAASERYRLALGRLLDLTLAGREPTEKIQLTADGTRLHWLAEGVLEVTPPVARDNGMDLLLSAGIHGNETAPMELLDELLGGIASGALRPASRLLFMYGNPDAMRRGTRYVEQDLNRLFNGRHAQAEGPEAQRANDLERLSAQFFSKPDRARLHYDLHTALRASALPRFALYPWSAGRQHSETELQRLEAAGIEAVLLYDKPGITFSAYTYAECQAEALTLELGQARPFGENSELDLSRLRLMLEALVEGREAELPPPESSLLRFRVARQVFKSSSRFQLHLADDVANFSPLRQGSLLAEDGSERWIVDEADARIIFPNPKVAVGLRAGLIVVPA